MVVADGIGGKKKIMNTNELIISFSVYSTMRIATNQKKKEKNGMNADVWCAQHELIAVEELNQERSIEESTHREKC